MKMLPPFEHIEMDSVQDRGALILEWVRFNHSGDDKVSIVSRGGDLSSPERQKSWFYLTAHMIFALAQQGELGYEATLEQLCDYTMKLRDTKAINFGGGSDTSKETN